MVYFKITEKVKRPYTHVKDILIPQLKYHFVHSAAQITAITPVYATFETFVAGMSDEVSIKARLLAAGITLAGQVYFSAKMRDFSKKHFNILDKTKGLKKGLHDSFYFGAINLLGAPILYFAAGARDPQEILIGTATSTVIGLGIGWFDGYVMDWYKDLAGIEVTSRLPKFLRSPPINKKNLIALITAASIGLTATVYALSPSEKINSSSQQEISLESIAQE